MSGKPYEAVTFSMKNDTSGINGKVFNRITHGLKPRGSTLPNITFFESGLTRFNGIESQEFTINCRDVTPEGALALSRLVWDLFHGSTSTGIYATQDGFDIARGRGDNEIGVIPEGSAVYNAPVIITLIYSSSTVS